MWLLLAISGQFVGALVHFIDKIVLNRFVERPIVLAFFTGAVSLTVATVITLVAGLAPMNAATAAAVLSGVSLFLFLLSYFTALSLDDVTRVTPLLQMIPVLALLIARAFLGETVSGIQYVGFAVVFASGLLLQWNRALKGFRIGRVFSLMLIGSIAVAVSMTAFKWSASRAPFWQTTAAANVGIALGALIVALLYPTQRKDAWKTLRSLPSAGYRALLAAQLLAFGSELLIMSSIHLGRVSLVSVTEGIQPVFVFVLGLVLSLIVPDLVREDRSIPALAQKFSCAALLACGVGMLRG